MTTSTIDLTILFEMQMRYSIQLRSDSVETRIEKLSRMKKWILKHRQEIKNALYADFNKPHEETDLTEIYQILNELNFCLRNLPNWVKSKPVPTPLNLLGSTSNMYFEPKGVCLIISPWNYPFLLAISPLISCIASGNTAFIKPSEFTPHTSGIIKKLTDELFDSAAVFTAGTSLEIAAELLKFPFDHIYFTGSPAVGKIVMKAASEHLTSITLELGGKSPVIIDKSCNLKDTASKIAFSKFLNSGQTCIAPDYVFVHVDIKDEFIELVIESIKQLYLTANLKVNHEAMSSIVNENHYNRLSNLLEDAKSKGAIVHFEGENDPKLLRLYPAVIINTDDTMLIDHQEIFGPLLVLKEFSELNNVIDYINERPKPLSLYLFARDQNVNKMVISKTSAGSVLINDCLIQFMQVEGAFGGIGNSGMGKSHGYAGFLEFSNQKLIMKQRVGFTLSKLFYTPYSDLKRKLIEVLIKYF
jgi:aldehyde dehydrogenase (NAD+)